MSLVNAFDDFECFVTITHTGTCSSDDYSSRLNRIPDSIGKEIEKACEGIYPLHNVFICKVKVLKKPKFDFRKLMEIHGEGYSETKNTVTDFGEAVARPMGYEPPVQQSV